MIDLRALACCLAWTAIPCACTCPPSPGRANAPSDKVEAIASSEPAPTQPRRVFSEAPASVYRNPKIGIIYLRAHQDSDGRLLGPQVMYEVIEPGGWNVEALESGNGYLPATNLEAPANLGTPWFVPAGKAPAIPAGAPLMDADAIARITITGLMDPGDKPEAEAMAERMGGACSAVYDSQAGWLLVPLQKK